MKLQVVPARTGAQWVRQGIRTFWKQPIALSGLFFMFMALMSICSLLPVIGSFVALMLLPAASLGLMAATREVDLGKFPMPKVLLSGFRTGGEGKRNMLILGLLYALGFVGVMGVSMLLDGGDFAKLYLVGGSLDSDTLMKPEFQNAMWLSLLLYMPLSAVFWHAPALVHWHNVPAIKSLFFSTVACLSNWRAFLVFGLLWSCIFLHRFGDHAGGQPHGRQRAGVTVTSACHAHVGRHVFLLDLLQLSRQLCIGRDLRLNVALRSG